MTRVPRNVRDSFAVKTMMVYAEVMMMLWLLQVERSTIGDVLMRGEMVNVRKCRKLTCSSSPCSEPCTRRVISCHFGRCVASRALLLHRVVRDGSKALFRLCHTWVSVQLAPY